jgi:hypothetical protein
VPDHSTPVGRRVSKALKAWHRICRAERSTSISRCWPMRPSAPRPR